MTSKKAKKVSENDNMNESDDSSSDQSDSGSELAENHEEIMIDFEGRNPSDADFNGIKQLLNQLFLTASINLTEMTDAIISQDYIGSVIKQMWDENMPDEDEEDDDEDSAFGVTTVINLTSRKDSKFVQDIKQLLISKAEKHATDSVLKLVKNILTNDSINTGLVINERYVNIPAQISVPMLENLCKEIKRAVEKNKPYNFGYLVMPLKFYRKSGPPVEDLYSNPEEEHFLKETLGSFEFSVEEDTAGNKMTHFRKILIIDGKKFPEIVSSLSDYINGTI